MARTFNMPLEQTNGNIKINRITTYSHKYVNFKIKICDFLKLNKFKKIRMSNTGLKMHA
jgi:hypothetical protein